MYVTYVIGQPALVSKYHALSLTYREFFNDDFLVCLLAWIMPMFLQAHAEASYDTE